MPSYTLCQQRRVGYQREGIFTQMINRSLPIPTVYEVPAKREDAAPCSWAWIPPGIHAGAQEVPRTLGLLPSWAEK